MSNFLDFESQMELLKEKYQNLSEKNRNGLDFNNYRSWLYFDKNITDDVRFTFTLDEKGAKQGLIYEFHTHNFLLDLGGLRCVDAYVDFLKGVGLEIKVQEKEVQNH